MKTTVIFILIIALVLTLSVLTLEAHRKHPKIICYLGVWQHFKNDAYDKYFIEAIKPNQCTHLIYGFATVSPEYNISLTNASNLKDDLRIYETLNSFKKKNKKLKILVAIRNWNVEKTTVENTVVENTTLSLTFESNESRSLFINNIVAFLKDHGFDGIDINWENQENKDGRYQTIQSISSLLKEIQTRFNANRYLLTSTVSAKENLQSPNASSDIPNILKYLDFINIRDFNIKAIFTNTTSHISPFYSKKGCPSCFNYAKALDYWKRHNVTLKKLILAIPFFGNAFTLANASEHSLGSPVIGEGNAGTILKEGGKLGYNEICRLIAEDNWTVKREKGIKSPFAYKDDQWVGYEDKLTIKRKVKLAKKLGGVMVWTLEADDFQGTCGKGKFPLLKTIRKQFKRKSIKTKTVTKDPMQTIIDNLQCPKKGAYPFPNDCRKFYICVDKKTGFDLIIQDCPKATKFNVGFKTCLWEGLVTDC